MPLPPRPDDDPRPEPPEQPDHAACCHSGCDPCIFDLYDEALDRWRAELAAWEARKAARPIARKAAGKGKGKDADVVPQKVAAARKAVRQSARKPPA